MATLAELKARLVKLEAAIDYCIENGESAAIVGSHSTKSVPLEELERNAALVRRRIYRQQGYTSRSTPDFSEVGGDNLEVTER